MGSAKQEESKREASYRERERAVDREEEPGSRERRWSRSSSAVLLYGFSARKEKEKLLVVEKESLDS